MNTQDFIKQLQQRGIKFQEKDGKVIVNNQGHVDLRSLTSLPEGTQFNNQGNVYLSSLTSLPEGTQFNNQGNVYLRSLTSLPEGTQFNNQGYVYLRSLTSLPEGTQFNNQGDVDLRSLTSLPEGTQFNNQGDVSLSSLTSLPEGTQFNNQGHVDLSSLTSLPEGTQFNNQGDVYLRSLTSLPEGTQFKGAIQWNGRRYVFEAGAWVELTTKGFKPGKGDLIGWKKVKLPTKKAYAIVEMLIPSNAKRCNGEGYRKCRAEFAKVISVTDNKGNKLKSVLNTTYTHQVDYVVEETVRPDKYDGPSVGECGHGINFFVHRIEAVTYDV